MSRNEGILVQENASGHQPEIHPCVIDNVPRFADAPHLTRDQAIRRGAIEEAARTLEGQLSLGYDAPENRSFRTGIQFSIRAIRALAIEESKP